MKQRTNEELQNWLEENGHKSDGIADVELTVYRHLFDLLSVEPAEGLPYGFRTKVVRTVQTEKRHRSEMRSYLMLIAIVSIIMGFIYGLFILLERQLGSGFLNIAAHYKWVFVLGIFSLLTIQYLDLALIKSTVFKKLRD